MNGSGIGAQYELSHPVFCQVTINDHHLEDIVWRLSDPPVPRPFPPPVVAALPRPVALSGVGVGLGHWDC